MSLSAQYGYALSRGAAVSVAAVLLAHPVCRLLSAGDARTRRLAWPLLLAPYLAPVLIVGYGWSSFSLSLVRHPRWNSVLYDVLLTMRLVPVAAAALYFAPSALSAQAVHCRRMLRARERGLRAAVDYAAFLARGPMRRVLGAVGVVFLLSFSEFELASLMNVRTWTVSLFDAHAGGLALSHALRMMALPAATQMLAVGLVLAVLLSARGRVAAERAQSSGGGFLRATAWAYLLAAAATAVAVPGALALKGTWEGMRVVVTDFRLAGDIGAGMLFGAAGAASAYAAAGWFLSPAMVGRRAALAFALCVPGLLGPLVLSLLLVAAFQELGWPMLYDSPVPLVLALGLLLFPFALLLRFLVQALRPAEGIHAAELLGDSTSAQVRGWHRRLMWHLKARSGAWVAFLLFCWGYFDLTASSILAPAGMAPVSVRLYNLMHYGHMAVLSAMVCAALAVPILLIAIAGGARGAAWRLFANG